MNKPTSLYPLHPQSLPSYFSNKLVPMSSPPICALDLIIQYEFKINVFSSLTQSFVVEFTSWHSFLLLRKINALKNV